MAVKAPDQNAVSASYTVLKSGSFTIAEPSARSGLKRIVNADSSAVIQGAISAVGASGGMVFVKRGTYTINTMIELKANQLLCGEGDGTILKTGNANVILLYVVGVSEANPIEHVTVRDLALQGHGKNTSGDAKGIHAGFANFCVFKDLKIFDFYNQGIDIYNGICYRNIISRNRILDCAYGVRIPNPRATSIVQNQIYRCKYYGIVVAGAGTKILGNDLTYISGDGVLLDDNTVDTLVAGNTFNYVLNREVKIDPGSFVNVVSGNSIARIGYDGSATSGGIGIEMSGHDNLVVGNNINHLYDGSVRRAYAVHVNACNSDLIVGNTIFENPVNSGIGYCVYLTGSDDNVVRDNLMVGTASQTCYGVYVADSACDNTVIEGNAFLANLSAKVTNNGTGTKIRRNVGYATENSGTATILSGQSSVQFAHGLAAAPSVVALGAKHAETADAVWSADAANMTITVPGAVTGDRQISWFAEV